jgi:hypothetical protein
MDEREVGGRIVLGSPSTKAYVERRNGVTAPKRISRALRATVPAVSE